MGSGIAAGCFEAARATDAGDAPPHLLSVIKELQDPFLYPGSIAKLRRPPVIELYHTERFAVLSLILCFFKLSHWQNLLRSSVSAAAPATAASLLSLVNRDLGAPAVIAEGDLEYPERQNRDVQTD